MEQENIATPIISAFRLRRFFRVYTIVAGKENGLSAPRFVSIQGLAVRYTGTFCVNEETANYCGNIYTRHRCSPRRRGGVPWCGDVTRRERVLVRNCQLALTYRSDGTLLGAFKNSWLPSERTALNNQIPPSPHPPSLPLDSEIKWNAVTGESTCDWDPEEND